MAIIAGLVSAALPAIASAAGGAAVAGGGAAVAGGAAAAGGSAAVAGGTAAAAGGAGVAAGAGGAGTSQLVGAAVKELVGNKNSGEQKPSESAKHTLALNSTLLSNIKGMIDQMQS